MGDWAPTNSFTTLPSRNALTAGIPLTPNCAGEPGVRVDVDLDELDRAAARSTSPSSTGASAWHGPHHSAQKSTTTGTSCDRSRTASSKVSSVTSIEASVAAVGLRRPGRRPRRSPRPAPRGPRRRRRRASDGWSRSTSISAQLVEAERLGAVRAADRPQLVGREDAAACRSDGARCPRARAAPRTGRSARSSPSRCRAGSRGARTRISREEAVAEVRLRRRARADRRAAVAEQVELGAVRVGRVNDGRPLAAGSRSPASSSIGRQAVLGEALLDLARLLVGVDVERQRLALGVASELLQPVARAGAHGVGGDPDARSLGSRSASTSPR